MIESDYIEFYDLEKYVLTKVKDKFNRKGKLRAFDFFCIVIFKSERAKTKIAKLLLNRNSDIEQSVRDLARKIFTAKDDKEKLKVLIVEYKFRLPMASAILSLLYPDNFTIYDLRVCETFPEFKGLRNKTNFENLWVDYEKYIGKVKAYEPNNLSLRCKDKLLWGKSFHKQLSSDLKNNFQK